MPKKETVVIRINENSPYPVLIRPTKDRDGQVFRRIEMIAEGVNRTEIHPIPTSENHSDDFYDTAPIA